jgi:septum formation protein
VRLILASASPRRREILGALGVEFEVSVPAIDEVSDGDPAEAVVGNALRKARAVAAESDAGALVLGVDTDVVLDDRILGKAADEGEARQRIEALAGRTHEVLSGVALVETDGGGEAPAGEDHPQPSGGNGPEPLARIALARSLVTFRDLDPATIDLYIRSGEWRDRAGAYAIQGLGSILVERLEGDFSNVVGLPISTLLDLAPELFAET